MRIFSERAEGSLIPLSNEGTYKQNISYIMIAQRMCQERRMLSLFWQQIVPESLLIRQLRGFRGYSLNQSLKIYSISDGWAVLLSVCQWLKSSHPRCVARRDIFSCEIPTTGRDVAVYSQITTLSHFYIILFDGDADSWWHSACIFQLATGALHPNLPFYRN